jgi:tetratricopeptide (TPR) repeat protein
MAEAPLSGTRARVLSNPGVCGRIPPTRTRLDRETTVTEQRTKKDEYQKILAAFGQAIKEFHKGDLEKAAALFEDFIEKHPAEREIVDRARAYITIARNRPKKETFSLKGFDDYLRWSVVRINQRDFESAVKLLQKALDFKEQEGLVYYLLADVHSLMGQTDPCLDYVKKAIQKDKMFSTLAQNEPDFEALWDDKKFKLLTRLA